MIEVFNAKRTRSFGCYASFRSAEDTLNRLAYDGILGDVPSVSISAATMSCRESIKPSLSEVSGVCPRSVKSEQS